MWYADDTTTCGKVSALHTWWDQVSSLVLALVTFLLQRKKTWLITKTQFCSIAKELFHDTTIIVTSDGRPHLGAPFGTCVYVESLTFDKVNQWILSSIAISQPRAAY